MKSLILIALITLLFMLAPSLLPPTTFEDCVLKELQGVNNTRVADLKAHMCDAKFPDHK